MTLGDDKPRAARPTKTQGRRGRMHDQPAPANPTALKSSALQQRTDPVPDLAEHPSIGQRVRYKFDKALARGPIVVIGYLGLVTLAIILLAAVIVTVFRLHGINGEGGLTLREALWQSILRVLDSGTFASDTNFPTRLVSLIVTLAGIFIAGSLIGLIASAVDQKIHDLRKGRSAVLETDHTLILGWSPRLPAIIDELVVANESRKKAAIVIMGEEDKATMEDELKRKVNGLRTTELVFRTGDPANPRDLENANLGGARSIVVLDSGLGDAGAVRSLLAIRSLDPRFEQAHVVVEMQDDGLAETIRNVTDGRVATVDSDHIIVEVTAQACVQAGMSQVYREILDFDQSEIYLQHFDEVVGRSYAEVITAFEGSTVMGRCTAGGKVELNPPPDRVFEAGDRVIALAEDDSTFLFDGFRALPDVPARSIVHDADDPQALLLVGWSSLAPRVIKEIDEFVSPGSTMDVVVDRDHVSDLDLSSVPTENLELRLLEMQGRPRQIAELCGDRTYDQAVVLGYREHMTHSDADARTLITLLALRRIWPVDSTDLRIVAELLDRGNVVLARTTGVDDFIVSDEVTSLMIAQLSEDIDVQLVYDELFDAAGASLAFRRFDHFVEPGSRATMMDVTAAGLARGETVLGWRTNRTREVFVNPPKSAIVDLEADDQLLVITSRN